MTAENAGSTVRAAITQVAWTGDKESMIAKHEQLARDAAAQGVQIIGFQELFYGPYFGIRPDQKYYAYTESIPGRPDAGHRRHHRAAELRHECAAQR